MAESIRKETIMKRIKLRHGIQLLFTSLTVGTVISCLLRLITMLHIRDPDLFLRPVPFGMGVVNSLYQTLREARLLTVTPYVIMVLHFVLSAGYTSKGDGSHTDERRCLAVSLYSVMVMVILIARTLGLLATAALPILTPLR